MKSIFKDLGNKARNIEIKVLSDLHIGSPKCIISELKKEIDIIAKDPNCYVLLGGDLIDNGTKGSVNPYGDVMSPMDQMKLVIDILSPIKTKILGICQGNHEERTYKESGTDLTWFLAKEFGLEDSYDPVGLCLFVRFGNIKRGLKNASSAGRSSRTSQSIYSIYMTHGSGGGSTIGGKANALHKRGSMISCDVICMGHTHQPMTWKEDTFVANNNSRKLVRKETTYVMTGSWLDQEDYSQKLGMAPTSRSLPVIELNGSTEFDVRVSL